MSKNKYGAYNVGDTVKFKDETVVILSKQKGNKTKYPNRQSNILTGFKSNPCLYTLSNGFTVRGDKLKSHSTVTIQSKKARSDS